MHVRPIPWLSGKCEPSSPLATLVRVVGFFCKRRCWVQLGWVKFKQEAVGWWLEQKVLGSKQREGMRLILELFLVINMDGKMGLIWMQAMDTKFDEWAFWAGV